MVATLSAKIFELQLNSLSLLKVEKAKNLLLTELKA